MIKKNLGITLISLIVTIIILLLLAGTATFTGINTIQSSRITKFKTEMELMRLQLNSPEELEKYKKTDADILSSEQMSFLEKVQKQLIDDNLEISLNIDEFKYFSKEDIKNLSNIEVSMNLYINTNTKTIVSAEGVKYNNKMCYMLEQFPDNLYNVEENISNYGDITFEVNSDKLTINISNINYNAPYVNKGTIQYKLQTDENWITVAENTIARNFSFEVKKSGNYDIRIIDAKNNESISNIIIEEP